MRNGKSIHDTVIVVAVDGKTSAVVLNINYEHEKPLWRFLGDQLRRGEHPDAFAKHIVERKLGLNVSPVCIRRMNRSKLGRLHVYAILIDSTKPLPKTGDTNKVVKIILPEEINGLVLSREHQEVYIKMPYWLTGREV